MGPGYLIQFKKVISAFKSLTARYFPERQLYFRANGVVRFISLSGRVQMVGASFVAAALFWVCLTTFNFLYRDQALIAKEHEIKEVTASYEALNEEIVRLETEISDTADQLEKRQRYLQKLLTDEEQRSVREQVDKEKATRESDKSATVTLPESQTDTRQRSALAAMFSNTFSTAARAANAQSNSDRFTEIKHRLRALQKRQMAIAAQLLTRTVAQIEAIENTIRLVGLTEDDLTAKLDPVSNNYAVGGPFLPIADLTSLNDFSGSYSQDTGMMDDPVFNLFQTQQRLEDLTHALRSMPVIKPVVKYYISSNFGNRVDPLRKTRAWHAGVDMAGWWNTPIVATGNGKVTRAGRNGAYGKFIEIDHGNGFKTRYGHIKTILVKRGQQVVQGEKIALMGSTGRSTGPHLHYEIWFAERPRNPVKFFKAADDVLKIRQEFTAVSGT